MNKRKAGKITALLGFLILIIYVASIFIQIKEESLYEFAMPIIYPLALCYIYNRLLDCFNKWLQKTVE